MLATDRNRVYEGGAFSAIYSIARWWDAERSGGVSKGEIRVVAIGGKLPDKFLTSNAQIKYNRFHDI